ncbi:MAG: class I SAM-dependent methyltransferase [Planctomycetota bacterium]|nr:class I SAM-dependent methyltransferase [Planctomycetota bacterium]
MILPSLPSDFSWQQEADQLFLNHKDLGLMTVDFLSEGFAYRLRQGGVRGNAVAKAVGLAKVGDSGPLVLDATAGLGRDAFLLAWLGCTVVAVERNPAVHALLLDGWCRACADEEVREKIGDRLHWICADAQTVMTDWSGRSPDVVYLDPMHPTRTKSALVKKEMRIFRALVGEDSDAIDLLPLAKALTPKVVVKRPRQGEALASGVSYVKMGKSTRFDVYLAPPPAS